MSFYQYKVGDTSEAAIGSLEEWPFTNPASQYVIKEGSPKAFGRLDQGGGKGDTSRVGLWKCTQGSFECTEQGDELMTVLSGSCQLTNHTTNTTYHLQAGDTLFIQGGCRVTWNIMEDIIKVFYGQKQDGY